MPFKGDYNGCSWNAQAYFAADPARQAAKQNHATTLLMEHDFCCISEAHSNEGKTTSYRKAMGHSAWWSHGSNAVGGVGILVRDSFLARFKEVQEEDWLEIIPGRVARIRLSGAEGQLDIYSVYMETGASVIAKRCRQKGAQTIANHMAPRSQRLSLITGDFNFVTHPSDRVSLTSGQWSGSEDAKEAEYWNTELWDPSRCSELRQSKFTHCSGLARSRLDRAYSNHHVYDQLDRNYWCHTLPHNPNLSAHCPISFGRRKPHAESAKKQTISNYACKQDDFLKRVLIERQELYKNDELASNNPFRKLILTKRAMHTVAKGIDRQKQENKQDAAEDRIGHIMSFIRAAEEIDLPKMRRSSKLCPIICQHVNPLDPNAREKAGMDELRNLVVRLAREKITTECSELDDNDPEVGSEENQHTRSIKKKNILGSISRLLPGNTSCIGGIMKEDGEVTGEAGPMAKAIIQHWAKVFSSKAIDEDLLKKWLEEVRPQRSRECNLNDADKVTEKGDPHARTHPPRRAIPQERTRWKPKRRNIIKALRQAGNSSPGPDGVPFAAWRALGSAGVDLLQEIAGAVRSQYSHDALVEAYHDECTSGQHNFNLSALVCLPKTPEGEDPNLGAYYTPKELRPLAIVNCDNRIIASATRWAWEDNVSNFVKHRQQGFLRGRAILRNIVDMDNAMLVKSLEEDDCVAVFLDFAAAFPSISQQFCITVLEEWGIPPEEICAMKTLFDESRCEVNIKGETFQGFSLAAGVRQGCPLSPLIYALAAELLLDMIEHRLPDCLSRAYADDTSILCPKFSVNAQKLVTIFEEFEHISKLELNKKKSLFLFHLIPKNCRTSNTSCRNAHPLGKTCRYGKVASI